MSFPLDQWFDITKPIPRDDADIAEAQMQLYALKDGEDPQHPDCVRQYKKMRAAVKAHNLTFKTKAA
jgi:hypothetical protein